MLGGTPSIKAWTASSSLPRGKIGLYETDIGEEEVVWCGGVCVRLLSCALD